MAREFFSEIRTGLVQGLRTRLENNKNSELLTECLNAEPTPFGLRTYKPILQGFTPALSDTFPFPQIFKGEKITLALDNSAIYEVDESDSTLTRIQLFKWDVSDSEFPDDQITQWGESWQFIDFGDSWYLVNGDSIIFRTNLQDSTGVRARTFLCQDRTIKAGTAHRGRTIIGGLADDFWSEELKGIFTPYNTLMPNTVDNTFSMAGNVIMWSNIGGGFGDIIMMLYPENLVEGRAEIDSLGVKAFMLTEFTRQPVNDETFTLDTVVFTFKTTVSSGIIRDLRLVEIGSDEEETKNNLITAINSYLYVIYPGQDASTIQRTLAEDASDSGTNRILLRASIPGEWGNSVAVSNTAGILLPNATLTSGSDGTVHSEERSLLMENLRMNQWGMKPMSFQGDILSTHLLGQFIIVYGEDGIDVMQSSDPRNTEFIGYSFSNISKLGVANRGAAGGHSGQHLFVDPEGTLWSIGLIDGTPDLKRLGYEEFIEPMLIEGQQIAISYDKQEQRFFISNGEESFVFKDQALSRTDQSVTSLVYFNKNTRGFFTDEGTGEFRLETDVQDNNLPSRKYITEVEINADHDPELELTVHLMYRFGRRENFRKSKSVKFNKDGSAMLKVVATEYKIVISGFPYQQIDRISRLSVKWQPLDRSRIRGTNVTQVNA